jgi:glycosyltransferase 2 family protein
MKIKHLGKIFFWIIVIATLIVIGDSLYDNWQAVQKLEIHELGWCYAIAALVISLLSHCLSAILWGGILGNLQYKVPPLWALKVFLTTEIAKYLPGDVWQVYGRLQAARKIGIPITVAIAATILQSVYLSAAGLGYGLLIASHQTIQIISALVLIFILILVRPPVFAAIGRAIERLPTTSLLQKMLGRLSQEQWHLPQMQCYPLLPILGQVLFLAIRSLSFLLVLSIFIPISAKAIVPTVAGFALAWALGVVSPISGGVGVFEATAIGLLDGVVDAGVVIGAVALYRAIALLTEAIGAGLGVAIARWVMPTQIEPETTED